MSDYYFDANGKIGVVLSIDYGTGWSTSMKDLRVAYDREIVEAVLRKESVSTVMDLVISKFGPEYSRGGYFKLQVKYVAPDRPFRINHHSGKEFIEYFNPDQWIIIE